LLPPVAAKNAPQQRRSQACAAETGAGLFAVGRDAAGVAPAGVPRSVQVAGAGVFRVCLRWLIAGA